MLSHQIVMSLALILPYSCEALVVSPRPSGSARTVRPTMSALPRVVITGMGAVSCLGNTLDEVTDSLYECKSGLTYCQEFADIGMKSQISGQPTNIDW